jgi:hypothetical protein
VENKYLPVDVAVGTSIPLVEGINPCLGGCTVVIACRSQLVLDIVELVMSNMCDKCSRNLPHA